MDTGDLLSFGPYVLDPRARRLTRDGADVRIASNKGVTALIAAVEQKSSFSVQLLLARGADVNARTNSGETALRIATSNGDLAVGELLRGAGAR